MEIKLTRDTFSDESTIGKLYIDGQYFCETLEDKDRYLEAGGKKEYGKTCIPRGKYKVELSMSNRFKKLLPILIAVPQFEGIRIHAGNYAGYEKLFKVIPIQNKYDKIDTKEYVEVI